MIRFCTCTGGLASTPERTRKREVTPSCKICGGKPLVEERGVLSGNMLSTVGLELSRVIDPRLNWKTVSKGNKRGTRRPRPSLTAGSIKNTSGTRLKESDKDQRRVEDMPVSESEKVGVTILGQRFRETTIESVSVPIKKRRFVVFRSPSPPPRSLSPHSEDSEQLLECPSASYNTECVVDSNVEKQYTESAPEGNTKMIVDDREKLVEVNEMAGDDVDFSGISILAAAACNSNIGGGASNAESPVTKGYLFAREGSSGIVGNTVESHSLAQESQEHLLNNVGKTDPNDLPVLVSNDIDGKKMEDSTIPEKKFSDDSQDLPNKDNETVGRVDSSSSRDDRSHWDLNTVMDAWESPCDDAVVDSQPSVVLNDFKDDNCGFVDSKMQEKAMNSCNSSDADIVRNKSGEACCSVPGIRKSAPTAEEHQSDASTGSDRSVFLNSAMHQSEDTASLRDREKISFNAEIITSSPVEHPLEHAKDSLLVKAVTSGCIVGSETVYSHHGFSEDTCVDHSAHVSEPLPGAGHISGNLDSLDNKDETSAINSGNRSEDHCISDSKQCKGIQPFDGATCKSSDESEKVDESPCRVGSHAFISEGSSNFEELSSASACVGKDETVVADVKADGGNFSVTVDENLNTTEMDLPVHVDPKDSMYNLSSKTIGVVAREAPMGGFSPHDECKSGTDDHVNCSAEVAREDPFDSEYDSDVSQNGVDCDIGIEKVSELQVDDDSQYEDGEFRISVKPMWEEVEGDDGEAEHVDYGSDNKDTDIFEDAVSSLLLIESAECKKKRPLEIDYASCEAGRVKRTEHEIDCQPCTWGSSKADVSDNSSCKERALNVAKKASIADYEKKNGRDIFLMNAKIDKELGAGKDNIKGDDGFNAKGDSGRESSHSASSKLKLSGWDQFPEGHKSFGEAIIDVADGSAERNRTGARFDMSSAGESSKRAVGSMMSRELSSRIEGPKSYDMPLRKARLYSQGSRADDRDDLNPKFERDTGPGKSIGRGGSSTQVRGRGGDNWSGSSGGHWGPNRHHSPGYYGPSGFSHHGPKNAAAVAAAKVESSGFVVAPDGTLVKAGSVVPGGPVRRRSVIASSQTADQSPTDRDGALSFGMQLGLGPEREISPDRNTNVGRGRSSRYGPRVVGGHRERFHGPGPDNRIESSLPMQYPFTRRERSFSPIQRRRDPLHLSRSHTKSPSRSRTRSPHMWPSPRGRSGGVGLRQHSRSPPNFRSEARMVRLRSPHRRLGFAEHIVGFVSASRSHGSPPHAPRWIDDRKGAPDHFMDHDYKRPSDGSPPGRIISRSHRFDLMGSPRRLKPDELYRPVHSGRFPEFDDVGRGPRRDESDDERRRHGDRYGRAHSVRHYDIDGDAKRFRYDIEDGFRAHNSRTKDASEFHWRGNPRDYDRGIDSRLGNNAPRRAREEKGHFRYARDGKHNPNFNSFGIRECEEDIAPRRRRPS